MIIKGYFQFLLLEDEIKIGETFQIPGAYVKLIMQVISVFYEVQLQNR